MATEQWARVLSPEGSHLRRGACYRVVRLSAAEAVLDVNGRPTPVPRPALEILPAPPTRWTVVPRPPRAPRMPASWGDRYAVCPNCRARARLDGHAASMRCPKCNGHFEIAWENT